jgi:putative endonuclease
LHLATSVVIARLTKSAEAIPSLMTERINNEIASSTTILVIIICIMERQYYIYIMTNKDNTVLYTGVTNDLKRCVYEHKEKLVDGFTKKYNIVKLVYYEIFTDIESAILREKQIKGGSRIKKIKMIESMNKEWKDLYDEL